MNDTTTESDVLDGSGIKGPEDVLPPPPELNTEIPDPVGVALDTMYVCPLCGWDCLVSSADAFPETERYHYRGQHPDILTSKVTG